MEFTTSICNASEESVTEAEQSSSLSAALADPESQRFIADLEFVQSLCNIRYLHFLAHSNPNYLSDPQFISYLQYLQYFKEPQYAKYLLYPQCLEILEMLLDEENGARRREELKFLSYVEFVHKQQGWLWMKHRQDMLRPPQKEPEPSSLDTSTDNNK